jgi:predicted Zn-dependent protease
VAPVRERGLQAAGYLEVTADARSVFNTSGMAEYYRGTTAQYSVTVRNAEGTGSGWAGMDHNEFTKIDTAAITQRAMQKCIDSADPRTIEPGRYTAILEPQAVHDLFIWAILELSRVAAERNRTAYTLSPGQSKLGLRMLDPRLTVSTDPMDPECSYFPFDGQGEPYKATKWFTDGILTELSYDANYALQELGSAIPQPNSCAYRIDGSGPPVSIEEMIASTQRGVLVTRFSGVELTDVLSLSCTGVTRDGLWLIERGKISHPIKNFRFNTSPLFVFNDVELIGTPTRVLAGSPAVVPAMRVRDFNFTSLADAV